MKPPNADLCARCPTYQAVLVKCPDCGEKLCNNCMPFGRKADRCLQCESDSWASEWDEPEVKR